MACACKNKKRNGQVTAVQQVTKQVVAPISAPEIKKSEATATTVRGKIVKRIMFKRH